MATSASTCIFKGCDEPVCEGSSKCLRHKKKGICRTSGCCNQVNKRGVCVSHGARDECVVSGCVSLGRTSGLCSRHSRQLQRQTYAAAGDIQPRRRVQNRTMPPSNRTSHLPGQMDQPWPENVQDMEHWFGEWLMMTRPNAVVMTDVLPDEDWPLVCQLLTAKSVTSASVTIEDGGFNLDAFSSAQTTVPSKVILSDVCIQPFEAVACEVNTGMGLTGATNDKSDVGGKAVPFEHANSPSSWLEWCQFNPSTLLLKDLMTFVGVDGECGALQQDPNDLVGAIDDLFGASIDFQFVPV